MAFKSSRPVYALVLLALSVLFVGATFLPLLYSILFPNDDLQRVVAALEDRGTPPLDADTVVQEARGAAGTLTKALQVGYYTGSTIQFHLGGSQAPEHIRESQATYIAWFQKRPKAMVIAISLYENDGGQKAYGIREGNPGSLVRAYVVPILLFGIALFLVRKRRSSSPA